MVEQVGEKKHKKNLKIIKTFYIKVSFNKLIILFNEFLILKTILILQKLIFIVII